jgi:hypothetical protein
MKRDATTVESRVKQHASAIAQAGTQSSDTTVFGPEFVQQSVTVMKRGLCRFLLTFAVLALPLQQSRSLCSLRELSVFHRSQARRYEIPRETEEDRARELSTTEVKQQIQQKLRTEPGLAGAKTWAEANDSYVVLAEAIDNDCQRDLALRIAESYAGKRKIVDKIKTRGANMRQRDKCGEE